MIVMSNVKYSLDTKQMPATDKNKPMKLQM